MKRKFWQWVHDRLEDAWSWVYRTKLAPPGDARYPSSTGNLGEAYWSLDPTKFPEVSHVEYWRHNPDGSFTLLDGPTDTAVIR